MKDNDLDVFEKWLEIEFGEAVDKSRSWTYEKSIFRFACEYKKAQNKKLINKIQELIEFEYGDCNCDSEKKCSYCKIMEKIKEVENEART